MIDVWFCKAVVVNSPSNQMSRSGRSYTESMLYAQLYVNLITFASPIMMKRVVWSK